MTARDEVLENHSLVVRGGRIIDVLPNAAAAARYEATVHVERTEHVLIPGLVNCRTEIIPSLSGGAGTPYARDAALLCIADMLKAGTTCFGAFGHYPEDSARAAASQGMRALIGLPIAESPTPWAATGDEHVTRALSFRDEYLGHPTIATAFAPCTPSRISDAMFGRIATLANELDAGILVDLHESQAEIDESVARHGLRPIERMGALGLLTPALTAAQMNQVNSADIAMAERGGVAITLCIEAALRCGSGRPAVASWAGTGLRLSVGTGLGATASTADLWYEQRLFHLLANESGAPQLSPWDVLAVATKGGAAALGLDTELGTLEVGKWADICCLSLTDPAMLRGSLFPVGDTPRDAPPSTPVPMPFNASRNVVNDVWVSGRQLLNGGTFTRLDWSDLTGRLKTWPTRSIMGA